MPESISPSVYRTLIEASERFLAEHGADSQKGVGWLRDDADIRYAVMLDVIREHDAPVTLLDFGCGTSFLYDYILRTGTKGIDYAGLDLSPRFLEISRAKYPEVRYYDKDVLLPSAELPTFDYIVMNGIFTYKGDLSFDAMFAYLKTLTLRLFEHARIGIAFNVITKQVEWERDDLFHLPIDPLLTFLSREVSRHVVVRHDYGLFEYAVYVYKTAALATGSDVPLTLRVDRDG